MKSFLLVLCWAFYLSSGALASCSSNIILLTPPNIPRGKFDVAKITELDSRTLIRFRDAYGEDCMGWVRGFSPDGKTMFYEELESERSEEVPFQIAIQVIDGLHVIEPFCPPHHFNPGDVLHIPNENLANPAVPNDFARLPSRVQIEMTDITGTVRRGVVEYWDAEDRFFLFQELGRKHGITVAGDEVASARVVRPFERGSYVPDPVVSKPPRPTLPVSAQFTGKQFRELRPGSEVVMTVDGVEKTGLATGLSSRGFLLFAETNTHKIVKIEPFRVTAGTVLKVPAFTNR